MEMLLKKDNNLNQTQNQIIKNNIFRQHNGSKNKLNLEDKHEKYNKMK